MIDVKFEIGGRRVDPSNMSDAIEAMLLQGIASEIHRKVSGVRNPDTGETPVVLVRGSDLENLSLEISGSEELVRLATERLGIQSSDNSATSPTAEDSPTGKEGPSPKAFLCHATEDKPLARRIAGDLQAAGIDTFFDEWEMRAGDSLRQKIDAGLGGCSHFIALLSPVSLHKPWVKAEMDGAFVLKLEGSCRFIPLRHGVSPELLPPLLKGSLSPSLDDYERDIKTLISDIYDISRKPPLGPSPPLLLNRRAGTGLSAAAEAIVRLVVERSKTGMSMDPQLSPDELRSATGMPDNDIIDAVDELHGLGLMRRYASIGCGPMGFHMVVPENELFAKMDRHFMAWNPEEDAVRIAADMVNSREDGTNVQTLAAQYGWEPRRMNPAVAFLANRRLINASREIGTHPWNRLLIMRTPATRRFVRDRSGPERDAPP
ncbi:MAG TPA: TIR domain-containing protein [Candidatus Binataceae bacterium]|nr:TIR domain-containing protein [Candidatus Binataceae bacterium]